MMRKNNSRYYEENEMFKSNYAAEYAYVNFTSYYYWRSKVCLGFAAKGL